MKFWNWLTKGWGVYFVWWKMTALERKLARISREAEDSLTNLDDRINEFDEIRKKWNENVDKSQVALKEAKNKIEKQERALAAAQDELENYRNIVVPGLLQSNQVFLSQWEQQNRVAAVRTTLEESRLRNFDQG